MLPIVRYFKETNSKIELVITTNGSYKTEIWWKELAEMLNQHDTITFSIDGWDLS